MAAPVSFQSFPSAFGHIARRKEPDGGGRVSMLLSAGLGYDTMAVYQLRSRQTPVHPPAYYPLVLI